MGWKPCVSPPDDPRPCLYLCRGEPWSWALCLPARIPGSQVGVARQPHHSALGCFAFGVKRDSQMSRHCHSSNLSPKEFLEVDHKRVFLECYAIPCQGLQDSNISLNLGICFHGLRSGSMMSTFYLPVAEAVWHVSAKWRRAPEN